MFYTLYLFFSRIPDIDLVNDIGIFLTNDYELFIRDTAMYLLFIGMLLPNLNNYEIIRKTRKQTANQCAKVTVKCSILLSSILTFTQIIFVCVKYKKIFLFIEGNYFFLRFYLMIFWFLCFMVVGFIYLVFLFKLIRKYKATVLTIFVVGCCFAMYLMFDIPMLYIDHADFYQLYYTQGFILPIPYIECMVDLCKYGVLAFIGYVLCRRIFQKQDVMRIED